MISRSVSAVSLTVSYRNGGMKRTFLLISPIREMARTLSSPLPAITALQNSTIEKKGKGVVKGQWNPSK